MNGYKNRMFTKEKEETLDIVIRQAENTDYTNLIYA